MAFVANPFRGAFNETLIDLQRKAHQKRFYLKDLKRRAQRMYGEMGKDVKGNKLVHKALNKKSKSLPKLIKGEKKELDAIGAFEQDFEHATTDLAAAALAMLEHLIELIKTDDELIKKYGLKVLKAEEEAALIARQKIADILKKAASTFLQEAT